MTSVKIPNNSVRRTIKFVVIVVLFSSLSCHRGERGKIGEQIHSILGEKLALRTQNMDCILPTDIAANEDEGKDNRLVVFIDSTRCTPCEIDRLYEWNALIGSLKQVDFVFVITPKKGEMEEVLLSAKTCGLRTPLYIDKAYTFRKDNVMIPDDKKYHTFLIDKDNRILLVGDPLRNTNIRELLEDIINNKTHNKQ